MEIEAKYLLPTPADAARIEALDWTPFTLGARHTADLHDTLWDTPDLQLSATRHAVRLRRSQDATLVTLKGPGTIEQGVHSREEIEEPAVGLDPSEWPAAIRKRLHALIDRQPIAPLVTIRNHRRTWPLLHGDRTIGEVALDEGTISAGDAREPLHELEVELKGGTRDDLEVVDQIVRRQLGAQPNDRSKAARGLALLTRDRSTTPPESS